MPLAAVRIASSPQLPPRTVRVATHLAPAAVTVARSVAGFASAVAGTGGGDITMVAAAVLLDAAGEALLDVSPPLEVPCAALVGLRVHIILHVSQ